LPAGRFGADQPAPKAGARRPLTPATPRLQGTPACGRGPSACRDVRFAHVMVRVNGVRVLERRDLPGSMRRGRIALVAYTGGHGECAVFYANVMVTRLEPEERPGP